MLRYFIISTCLLGLCATSSPGQTNSEAEVVKKGKKATGLVVTPAGSGSAFCIDAAGVFLTNAHVVGGKEPVTAVSLILNPGETDEKVLNAKVVRTDGEADLALLLAETRDSFTALELGSAEGLHETMALTAFGYPFGSALTLKGQNYPNVSVNVGRVTSLRKTKGVLAHIQLDAQLNPGNSGGPVLDKEGKVVGVVAFGIRGAGVNFAIPVNQAADFLSKPEILFTPPAITEKSRYEATEFNIKVLALASPNAKFTVELILSAGEGDRRIYPAKLGKAGTHQVSATPVVARGSGKDVAITAEFPRGAITCRIPDLSFKVGDQTVKFSEVDRFERGEKGTVVSTNGKQLSGLLSGLEPVDADLGGFSTRIDLSKAVKVTVAKTDQATAVRYTILVSQEGKSIGKLEGTLPLPGSALRRGLLALWRFDDGSGDVAFDSSPNAAHGKLYGPKWVEGKRGKALEFDGKNDYVDFGSSAALNFPANSSFTYTGWIKTEAKFGMIISQRKRTDRGTVIYLDLQGSRLRAFVRQDRGNEFFPNYAEVKGGIVNDNKWHHFALVRVGDTIELFLDGVSQGKKSGTDAGGSVTTDERYFGSERSWVEAKLFPPEWRCFRGCLDEVSIYNRALSAEEIRDLATNPD